MLMSLFILVYDYIFSLHYDCFWIGVSCEVQCYNGIYLLRNVKVDKKKYEQYTPEVRTIKRIAFGMEWKLLNIFNENPINYYDDKQLATVCTCNDDGVIQLKSNDKSFTFSQSHKNQEHLEWFEFWAIHNSSALDISVPSKLVNAEFSNISALRRFVVFVMRCQRWW